MTADWQAISDLLTRAETAHGLYEVESLQGHRDEAWPTWYAQYLIDHGLLELLSPNHPRKMTVPQLAPVLAQADAYYQSTASPNERWQDSYAHFLLNSTP